MVTRLEEVQTNGKNFLDKSIKFAENAYDTELKKLKAIETDIENDKKLTGAAKERKEKEIKDKQDKLLAEYKRLEKKLEDDEKAVEDQKDKVENASNPQKKKAENSILNKLERTAIETEEKMLTTRRDHNILGERGVKDAIKEAQEAVDVLATFKKQAVKMPKSV